LLNEDDRVPGAATLPGTTSSGKGAVGEDGTGGVASIGEDSPWEISPTGEGILGEMSGMIDILGRMLLKRCTT
jgi:hypothetical protein